VAGKLRQPKSGGEGKLDLLLGGLPERLVHNTDDRQGAMWTACHHSLACVRSTHADRFRTVQRELVYDVMLEVQGVLRAQTMRMRLNRELEVGETLDAHGRGDHESPPRQLAAS
jgi:hypothetical protein